MVLILSVRHDISTDLVMDWLNLHNIPVLRINGDEDKFSFHKVDSSGIYFMNNQTSEVINLSKFKACWWRRFGIRLEHYYPKDSYKVNDIIYGIESIVPNYIKNEIVHLHNYVLNRLYNDIPINLGSPKLDLNRLLVLEEAQDIGLAIPSYAIITSSKQLQEYQNIYGEVVSKAIKDGIYDIIENERFYTYTELIDPNFVKENTDTPFAPSLIMKKIEKEFEIRSFYIDGQFFSMAIFSQGSEHTKIDYRIKPPKVEVPYKLPQDIENKLRQLYNNLNLNTGSADLIVTPSNEFVFLEINPVGQFGMTSVPCNYNLEEKIAKYLMNGSI